MKGISCFVFGDVSFVFSITLVVVGLEYVGFVSGKLCECSWERYKPEHVVLIIDQRDK